MQLLTPLPLPDPTVDRHSRSSSSSSSMASYGAELERLTSLNSRLCHIHEEKEDGEDEGTQRMKFKVYVAVGRSTEKTVSLLQWAFRNFRNSEFCLVHVHQPSPSIPTLLGKLPATQANAEVVAQYRNEEREKMRKLLRSYLDFCCKAKVKVSSIITEDEEVHKGIINMVMKHGMQKLVMGSVPEKFLTLTLKYLSHEACIEWYSCMNVKKISRKAHYAAKNAPTFCEIWFIHKGKHIWTKEASETYTLPTTRQVDGPRKGRLRSNSSPYKKSERLYSPINLYSRSSSLSIEYSGMINENQNEPVEELMLPSSPGNPCISVDSRSSINNDFASITSIERRASSEPDIKVEEENLYSQLSVAKAEIVALKDEAISELLKRQNLEAEAMKAMRKVKDFESVQTCEAELRKEAEESLKSLMHEQERILEEKSQVLGDLQKTNANVVVLDSRVQEANRRWNEVAGELKLVRDCIANLQQEKQKIERQKMEAESWLEKWRSRRQIGGTNHHGYGGLLDDAPELVEFSQSDLQTATCNFSDSFKLFEGGFGSVYKGELLNRTVVILRLHAHNIHPIQFHKEVQILGKLRHPHLVTLIGSCPEAWSLVYDYVSNGSLQWHLLQKSNIAPLSWKTRTRIISQISTALLFLHSSRPEKIIHGDLKLECILLDSDLHCKICDFGISRLLLQDTLQLPGIRCYPEPQGAFPYRDPEFHRTGKLSPKSDIYSFGIIILHLLTGQPPVGLVANVRKAVAGGKLGLILDSSAGEWEPFVAEKLAGFALRFCEHSSRDRPELTPSLVKELQQLHISKERTVPSFFLCPILQEIMRDPQVAADGFTYEGDAIREWLDNGRETSPMTNVTLDYLHLTPNNCLRLSIQEWLCKY
ncbi:U-box domain-containing protein 33 [Bienertia sinuspersici]